MATNTMGARQGEGGVTVPSKSASPVVVAGVVPTTWLTIVGAPAASLLWQLRIMAKVPIGFVLLRTSTRPRTLTSSSPFAFNSAFPEAIFHGAPAPPMPRMALAGPVKGGTTAVSRLNSKMPGTLSAPFLAAAAMPTTNKHINRTPNFFIGDSVSWWKCKRGAHSMARLSHGCRHFGPDRALKRARKVATSYESWGRCEMKNSTKLDSAQMDRP